MLCFRVYEVFIPSTEFAAVTHGFDYLWVKYTVSLFVRDNSNVVGTIDACDVIRCGYTQGLDDTCVYLPRNQYPKNLINMLRKIHR